LPDEQEPPQRPRVHPTVDRLAAYSWRLIVIGIVVVTVVWLLSRLRTVLVPVVLALFLTRGLAPIARALRRHRWRSGVAATASLVVFFIAVAAVSAVIVPVVASEADSIRPTVTKALDDIENWLVNDSPFNISRDTIDRLRERAGTRVRDFVRGSNLDVVDTATLAAEVIASALLAVILTFFMLRDGDRFTDWALQQAPANRRNRLRAAADRGWQVLGSYLRGAALLGIVEAVLIGLTLLIGGGGLVLPVMILTFVAAFVPIIGAITAGVVAVLVALVTGGLGTAVAVGVVALVVQQLDNDLLSPWIYGRALALHPVVILLSVVAGGALFGIAGTLLAVPTVAVGVNTLKAYRAQPPEPGDSEAENSEADDSD
jgi:predicted PurR-regulated permease PerM